MDRDERARRLMKPLAVLGRYKYVLLVAALGAALLLWPTAAGTAAENAQAAEETKPASLRETEEELSIPREAVTLLGTPDFICSQRGFLLRPVLGLVSQAGLQSLRPSPAEVAEAFTVPLAFFRETPPDLRRYELVPQVPEDFPYGPVGIPRDYPWSRGQVEIPIWRYQGRAIWGMTARLVREIIR